MILPESKGERSERTKEDLSTQTRGVHYGAGNLRMKWYLKQGKGKGSTQEDPKEQEQFKTLSTGQPGLPSWTGYHTAGKLLGFFFSDSSSAAQGWQRQRNEKVQMEWKKGTDIRKYLNIRYCQIDIRKYLNKKVAIFLQTTRKQIIKALLNPAFF